jgi:HSP20 family protein
MAPMQTVGLARVLPRSTSVRKAENEYLVELDVSDFASSDLTVELEGRELTVVGDQRRSAGDSAASFRLHERLEESFRLPEDVDAPRVTALFDHGLLEIHAPRFVRTGERKRTVPVVRKGHRRGRFNADATPC